MLGRLSSQGMANMLRIIYDGGSCFSCLQQGVEGNCLVDQELCLIFRFSKSGVSPAGAVETSDLKVNICVSGEEGCHSWRRGPHFSERYGLLLWQLLRVCGLVGT